MAGQVLRDVKGNRLLCVAVIVDDQFVVPVIGDIDAVTSAVQRPDFSKSQRRPKLDGSFGWFEIVFRTGARFQGQDSACRQKEEGRGRCPGSWSKSRAHRKF